MIGVWRLVSWQLIGPDGHASEPFGPTPRGLLTYTADGHMSVVMSVPDRPVLPSDPAARTLPQKAAAYDRSHAYAGRYTLGEGQVIHHVQVSSMPNYEGADQVRQFELAGDRLTLNTPPGRSAVLAPGSATFGRLVWQRID